MDDVKVLREFMKCTLCGKIVYYCERNEVMMVEPQSLNTLLETQTYERRWIEWWCDDCYQGKA